MGDLLGEHERRQFMRNARQNLLNRMRGGGGYTGGPTAGAFGVMSGSQPTADDMNAFTNRNIARAQFGRAWQGGGFPRYSGGTRQAFIGARQGQNLLEARRNQFQDKLKIRKDAREQEEWDMKKRGGMFGMNPDLSTPGINGPVNPPQGQQGNYQGTPLNPPNSPAQAPAGPKPYSGGGITVPPVKPGEYRDPNIAPPGRYESPGEYDPGLGQRVRKQITNERGVRKARSQNSQMDPGGFEGAFNNTPDPFGMKGQKPKGPRGGAGGSFAKDKKDKKVSVSKTKNKAMKSLASKPKVDLRKGLQLLHPNKKKLPQYAANPQPLHEARKTLPRNRKMDEQLRFFYNRLFGNRRSSLGIMDANRTDIW